MQNLPSPAKIRNLGKLPIPAVLTFASLLSLTSSTSAGDHKKLVPLTPYYGGTVAYAPVASYAYPGVAGYGPSVYGASPTAGYYQVAQVPTATVMYGNGPQTGGPVVLNYGTGTVNGGVGNSPTANATPVPVSGSRLSVEGLKDVHTDLQTEFDTTIKKEDQTQVGRRAKLTTSAKEKYVTVLGDQVTGVGDLNKSENQEILGIVDLVMRSDSTGAINTGYGPQGSGIPYVGGYAPTTNQPMLYYYYYPTAPVKPHHLKSHSH